MIEQRTYRVGGHMFAMDIPYGMLSEKELSAYAPFRTDSCMEKKLLFKFTLLDACDNLQNVGEQIADLEDENGRMQLFTMQDGGLTIFLFSAKGNICCRLHMSKNFKDAYTWIDGTPDERRYALDTTLMLLYTFASSKHDTLLLHASAVEHDGRGYIFLGKSGTGKSTHSRLWMEHIAGAKLLNDDNPVIRVLDGQAFVFGSPWSGKTPCYLNCNLPLDGIVRLNQATHNCINQLSGVQAYAALLPSCSCMKWNHTMAEDVHNTLCKIIDKIPVYNLECLPESNAAILCHNKIGKKSLCEEK